MTDTPRICAVPGCGEPIVRRPGEKPSKLVKRLACSEPCRIKLMRLTKTGSAEPVAAEPRVCAIPACGNVLVRRPTEGNRQWAARKCCSMSCSTKLKHRDGTIRSKRSTQPAELRRCNQCGGPIPWHPWMQKQNYEARRTCGQGECKSAHGRACAGKAHEVEMKAVVAELQLSVTPRHIQAYLAASDDERRLFAPGIQAVAEARMGRG